MDFALGPLDCIGCVLQLSLLIAICPTAKRVLETAATGAASRLASYFLITLFHCVNLICSAVKMEISQGGSLELWRLRFSCLIPIVTLLLLFRLLALLQLRFPRLKLGLFIAGVAGSIFYSATAIVAMIYCDSTLVFDLMGIALTITMNVMGFINQDPYHMDIDHSTLWVSVMGAISAIVSCFTSRYGDTTCLPVLIASITSAVFKVLDVLLRLTCPYCGSARDLINYFLSRLHEIFE